MRYALFALAAAMFAQPVFAQAALSEMKPAPMTGSLPIKETTELGGRNIVPHTANDVSLASKAKLKSGDPKIRAMAAQRRGDAVKLAALVQGGQKVPPEFAARLREAIDGDMELWRDEYRVNSRTFKLARREWLEGMEAMDANTLALLRAELFTARDTFNATAR